jgi:hypothetical protein
MGTGLNSSASVLEPLMSANVTAAAVALHVCGKRTAMVSAAELCPVLRSAVTCQAPTT